LVRQERAAHKTEVRGRPDSVVGNATSGKSGEDSRVMIGLRYVRQVVCALVAMSVFSSSRHAVQGQERIGATKPPTATCQRASFRVVVDVGHTVAVPGALSARGVAEYAFNLQLAQETRQALVNAGFDNAVLMIIDKPPPRGVVERALIANGIPADLFISIHHDSVPDNLLQTWDYEGQPNHYNDDYPGYAIFISNDNGDRAGSFMFGSLLGKALQERGLQYTPHYTLSIMGHRQRILVDAKAGVYRYDQLIVLRMTRMPAVLLEAGSIVNRQEEMILASPERRALTSAAVVAAVEEFCAARARPTAAKAVSRPGRANPAAVLH
jgi:N-acetylmuramoyl-L-alanine amidase